jgi:hypothetical protein
MKNKLIKYLLAISLLILPTTNISAWQIVDASKSGTTRVESIVSSATPTPNIAATDIYEITALAEAATFGAPVGSPINGQKLLIKIKDNATARALSWNAIYRYGTDIALPATTVISKTIYIGFIYNSTANKWDLVGAANGL